MLSDSEREETLSSTGTRAPESSENHRPDFNVNVNYAQNNKITAESTAPQNTSKAPHVIREVKPRR